MWHLGPDGRQWLFTCVWVCVCIFLFFLHMGVIWSFLIPLLAFPHASAFTSALWISCLCGPSLLWLRPKLLWLLSTSSCSIRFISPSQLIPTSDTSDRPVTWTTQPQIRSPASSCFWLTGQPGQFGCVCKTWQCVQRSGDVDWGGSEVNWGRGWGLLQPFDLWCHPQSLVCLCALQDCFRGRGWALARRAVVWLSL